MDTQSHWYQLENASEIPSPTLLLYPDRIRENIRRMIRLAGGPDKLRPHVKTHKLPQVIEMELAAGITKFKAATIAECEMVAQAGGRDILLAYPIVGPNIDRFLALQKKYPQSQFEALVDELPTLRFISQAAQKAGVPARLMIDLNVGMNRTGIAPGPAALELYRTLCKSPSLVPAGLHAYDGHLHDADSEVRKSRAKDAFEPVWKLRQQLQADGLSVPKVVASGSPTFPFLATQTEVEVGCGTTVLWDFGQNLTTPELDFQHAAVLLTRVISKPTSNRLCLDLGHKAVASEMPHPRVQLFGLEDAQFVGHSEEHLVLETPRAHSYSVGDCVYGIPRHVCPTVALQSEVWVVEGQRAGERWEVIARRRRITI